jgi:hypothetical protein
MMVDEVRALTTATVEHLRAAVIDAAGTGLQQAGLAAHRNPLTDGSPPGPQPTPPGGG